MMSLVRDVELLSRQVLQYTFPSCRCQIQPDVDVKFVPPCAPKSLVASHVRGQKEKLLNFAPKSQVGEYDVTRGHVCQNCCRC